MTVAISGHIDQKQDDIRRTVIIGCNGRMGHMLLEKSLAAGLNVSGLDLPYSDANLQQELGDAFCILLCVPANRITEVLEQITRFMSKDAILSDITSVKVKPMRLMEELWPGPVIGTHPLFGPEFSPDQDLPVVLTPGRNARNSDIAFIAGFFKRLGFRTFISDADAHDKAMAKIQNMNFITNLAFFAALADQDDLLPFLTPSFERRKNAAKKMLTEDAEMFNGLFEANGYSHEAVRQFRRYLNLAASGDIELLCSRASWWWENNGKTPKPDFTF